MSANAPTSHSSRLPVARCTLSPLALQSAEAIPIIPQGADDRQGQQFPFVIARGHLTSPPRRLAVAFDKSDQVIDLVHHMDGVIRPSMPRLLGGEVCRSAVAIEGPVDVPA